MMNSKTNKTNTKGRPMFSFSLDTNEVVKALALEGFDKKIQEQMAERVRALLDERVSIRVESGLTAEEIAELSELKSSAEIKAYIHKLTPDLDQLYSDELDQLFTELRVGLGLSN
jgi:hypothetical protein